MSDILTGESPWVRAALVEHPKGSGAYCTRCETHAPFNWSDPQLTLERQVNAFLAVHGKCKFVAPKIASLQKAAKVTYAEALAKATVFYDDGALTGNPMEVRIAQCRVGPFFVTAIKRGDNDPEFTTNGDGLHAPNWAAKRIELESLAWWSL